MGGCPLLDPHGIASLLNNVYAALPRTAPRPITGRGPMQLAANTQSTRMQARQGCPVEKKTVSVMYT